MTFKQKLIVIFNQIKKAQKMKRRYWKVCLLIRKQDLIMKR